MAFRSTRLAARLTADAVMTMRELRDKKQADTTHHISTW
jgi:hypothetical protein